MYAKTHRNQKVSQEGFIVIHIHVGLYNNTGAIDRRENVSRWNPLATDEVEQDDVANDHKHEVIQYCWVKKQTYKNLKLLRQLVLLLRKTLQIR